MTNFKRWANAFNNYKTDQNLRYFPIFVKTFVFDEDQIASYDKLMQKNPGDCKKVFLPLSMSQVNLTLLRGCFLTNLIRVIS